MVEAVELLLLVLIEKLVYKVKPRPGAFSFLVSLTSLILIAYLGSDALRTCFKGESNFYSFLIDLSLSQSSMVSISNFQSNFYFSPNCGFGEIPNLFQIRYKIGG